MAVNCPAAIVPVPARDIDKVGLDPLDVTATLPLALAADEGVKVTVKVALCAAASVTGVEIPLNAKPVPLIPTLEIVRVEPPVFVRLSDSRRLLPTWTVPKSRLVGLVPSAPGVTPVPETAIDSEGFTASEVMVTLPLEAPVVAGAKADRESCIFRGIQRKRRGDPAQLKSASAHRGLSDVDGRSSIVGQRNCLAALAPHRDVAKGLAGWIDHQLTIAHSGSGQRNSRRTVGGVTGDRNRGAESAGHIGSKNKTDR